MGYICHAKSEVDYTNKSEVILKRIVKNTLTIIVMFIFVNIIYAKNYKISGNVFDITGETISNATIVLLNDSNEEIANDKSNKKGAFQFKKIESGKYLLTATKDNEVSKLNITVETSDIDQIELTLGPEESISSSNENKVQQSNTQVQNTENIERVPQDQYVLTEISFELKKMGAEIDNLSSQLRDLQARSEMWVNPLSIYQKEIILNNGSTVFGKIVYQDEETLKVETLVGFLVIDRSNVVRIVENVMAQEDQEYIPEQIRESYSPPPMPKLAEPRYVSDSANRSSSRERAANIVLVGNIAEKKDKSNNVTFTGQVKNVGGQRADFVKVNFVLRKNWSGETRTLTSFVAGSYYTFDSGITTDSSLLPGATGEFELIVPSDIGSFLGYSYTIDWEEYE